MYQKRRKQMAPKTIMPIMEAAAMEGWPAFREVFVGLPVLASRAGESAYCVVSFQKRCSTSLVSFWGLFGMTVSLVTRFVSERVWSARGLLTFNIR
jgi:hypothetical protein